MAILCKVYVLIVMKPAPNVTVLNLIIVKLVVKDILE